MDSSILEYVNTIKQKDLEIDAKNEEITKLKEIVERIRYNYENLDIKYDKIVRSMSNEELTKLLD